MIRSWLIAAAATTVVFAGLPARASGVFTEVAYASAQLGGGAACFRPFYGSAESTCATGANIAWALEGNEATIKHTVTVRSGSLFSTSFTCGIWPMAGNANDGILNYPTTITFTAANQNQTLTITQPGTQSILVTCDGVPSGDSIATLTWNE